MIVMQRAPSGTRVTGTPSFVVGDQLLVGAVGQMPLEEAIRATRK